eukprot:1380867-Rhodomonas_salina.1
MNKDVMYHDAFGVNFFLAPQDESGMEELFKHLAGAARAPLLVTKSADMDQLTEDSGSEASSDSNGLGGVLDEDVAWYLRAQRKAEKATRKT